MDAAYWTTGRPCWVRDDKQAFIEVRVIRRLVGSRVLVAVDEGGGIERDRECDLADLLPRDLDQHCEAEMDNMKDLNAASVLHNIVGLLFSKNSIYSSVGPILIAMNPYTDLPIFGLERIWACHNAMVVGSKVPPHAYRTAELVYQSLRKNRQQAVVICGESGAGKTVTCKKMLEYLCEVANKKNPAMDPPMSRQTSHGLLRCDPHKIVQANVVLEAFGNAKTLRNDNSSRFGKFTKVMFDPDNEYKLRGCDVQHYLLERSRVCHQPPGERNYHVFFQLLRSGQAEKYGLQGCPKDFGYTKDGASVTGFDDAHDFKELCDSMTFGGFEAEAQESIFQVVAAVLLLGNVAVDGDQDTTKIDEGGLAIRQACQLLGIDPSALCRALTAERLRIPGGDCIMKPVGLAKALAQRDAVAKTLYARLFKDMVELIGRSLGGKHEGGAVIGLLDIFGFEDMAINGFEQMFINLTNERIQKLFNDVVIQRELEIYSQEGILGAAMFDMHADNSECVRLFTASKPPGIVKLLSGQCQLGEEHDGAKFVQVLSRMIPQECWNSYFAVCVPRDAQNEKKAKNLPVMPKYEECFIIRHYCSRIMYTVRDFVTKSRDALMPHLHEVMEASAKPNINILWSGHGLGEGETVGEKFCGQLRELAEVLDAGECCFVRCIKTNGRKLAGTVNRPMVLEQLLHSGVVAALEMRRSGLPERMEYQSFNFEFQSLERCVCGGVYKFPAGENCRSCGSRRVIDAKQGTKNLLLGAVAVEPSRGNCLEGRDFAFGATRVFMSTRVYHFLQAVVKLRWKHFANDVVAKWRFTMCAVKIRAIEESWGRFQAIQGLAQDDDLTRSQRVVKAFDAARCKLEPPHLRLEEEKLKYPALDSMLGNEKKKVLAQIAGAIGDCPGIKHAAAAVESEVQKVIERKAKACEARCVQVQKSLGQLAIFMEIVERIGTDCDELADVVEAAELAKCRIACGEARAAITDAQTIVFPILRGQVPASVDLDSDSPLGRDSEVVESLARVQGVVQEAEGLGQAILQVRAQFLLVAKELEEQRLAKLEELSDLQTTEFVEEGLHEVVEIIDIAWQRSALVDDLLKAARDGDAYRVAVEDFLKDVDKAKQFVQAGRKTLERAKSERAEKQKLYAQVSEYKGRLAEALGSMTDAEMVSDPTKKLRVFFSCFRVLMDEAAALWEAGRGERELSDWRVGVEAWEQRAEASLGEFATHRAKALGERRSQFASRIAMFGDSPERKQTLTSKSPVKQLPGRSTAATKITNEGMSRHAPKLLQIADLVDELHRDGADRGSVQSCWNHFVTSAYRGGDNGARIFGRVHILDVIPAARTEIPLEATLEETGAGFESTCSSIVRCEDCALDSSVPASPLPPPSSEPYDDSSHFQALAMERRDGIRKHMELFVVRHVLQGSSLRDKFASFALDTLSDHIEKTFDFNRGLEPCSPVDPLIVLRSRYEAFPSGDQTCFNFQAFVMELPFALDAVLSANTL